ncbi:TMEM175 potassium channel family protein [Sphingomonas sp. F9_3S_D5_B_2]
MAKRAVSGRAANARAASAGDDVHAHTPAHPLERLIFFSDAVFAIAITLLIIEVTPPHLGSHATDGDHLIALVNLSSSFVAFFISFFVIGAFWAGHHRAFSLARHWSPGLVMPNTLMLAAIVFMPFATAYMGLNMGQRVPTVFYDLVLMTTGLLNIQLVRRATAPPVVDEQADPLVVARTRARGWGVTLGAAIALALALFVPRYSQFGLLTIPLWLRLAVGRAEKRLQQ